MLDLNNLHQFIRQDDAEKLEILLDNIQEFDINQFFEIKVPYGNIDDRDIWVSILHLCAHYGSANSMQMILDKYKSVEINQYSYTYETADTHKDHQIGFEYYPAIRKMPIKPRETKMDRQTPLHTIINSTFDNKKTSNHLQCSRILLDAGADFNLKLFPNYGYSKDIFEYVNPLAFQKIFPINKNANKIIDIIKHEYMIELKEQPQKKQKLK